MRGTTTGLRTPHPIGGTLPALYLEDPFAQQLCAALDDVLAPVLATLDCFAAYLDPRTTPPDILDWLAGWVGMDAARRWPLERRRALVARAAELHAWRGTPYAITEMVELATGTRPDLRESGATVWSQRPGRALPGRSVPGLVIVVRTTEPGIDEALLTRLISLVAPAHLPWRVELDTGTD